MAIAKRPGTAIGGSVVEARTVRWYRLAADQGYAAAQYNLGLSFANGEGVPENNVAAYMWWDLAAAQGEWSAKQNKEEIKAQMTPEQIAEAQKLSAEWTEKHQ